MILFVPHAGSVSCRAFPMPNRWCDIGKVYDGINSCIVSEPRAYSRAKFTSFYWPCTEAFIMAVSAKNKCFVSSKVFSIKETSILFYYIYYFLFYFRSCVRATLKNFMITFFFPIIFTTMFLQNFRTPYDFMASSVVVDANPRRLPQQN